MVIQCDSETVDWGQTRPRTSSTAGSQLTEPYGPVFRLVVTLCTAPHTPLSETQIGAGGLRLAAGLAPYGWPQGPRTYSEALEAGTPRDPQIPPPMISAAPSR